MTMGGFLQVIKDWGAQVPMAPAGDVEFRAARVVRA